MLMRQKRARGKRRQSGSILVDVMIGMFFMMLATLTLMSLFPVVKKGEQMSTEEAKAVQMCNRLVEHIKMLGADEITVENLVALNLVDKGQSAQPLSFTNMPMDDASRYSPGQILRGAKGTLTFSDVGGGSVRVNVVLSYTSDSGKTKTISTGTVVGAFR